MGAIKYYFRVQVSEKTGFFHLAFFDLFGASRIADELLRLFPQLIGKVYYDHNGGWANSIVIKDPADFNNHLATYVWPSKERNYFMTNFAGELLRPDNCCRCGAKDPPIRETVVKNNKAVAENAYCAGCSADFIDTLVAAGYDG